MSLLCVFVGTRTATHVQRRASKEAKTYRAVNSVWCHYYLLQNI